MSERKQELVYEIETLMNDINTLGTARDSAREVAKNIQYVIERKRKILRPLTKEYRLLVGYAS